MGYLEFLDLLLEEEHAVKEERRIRHALRISKMPHHKTLEEFDFSYQPTLDDMVRQLKAADAIGRLTSKMRAYVRPHVLVLDEVGYQPLARDEANLVFQMISKRYEKGSILLASNKAFSEWGQVFGDEVLATAILDRLLHLRGHRDQRSRLPA